MTAKFNFVNWRDAGVYGQYFRRWCEDQMNSFIAEYPGLAPTLKTSPTECVVGFSPADTSVEFFSSLGASHSLVYLRSKAGVFTWSIRCFIPPTINTERVISLYEKACHKHTLLYAVNVENDQHVMEQISPVEECYYYFNFACTLVSNQKSVFNAARSVNLLPSLLKFDANAGCLLFGYGLPEFGHSRNEAYLKLKQKAAKQLGMPYVLE